MKILSLFLCAAALAYQDPMKEDPNKQQEPKKEEPKKEEPKKEEPKKEEPKKQDEPKVAPLVSKLNEIRKLYGAPPVEEDEALSSACKKHADYLNRNNDTGAKEDPHDENKKKAAYSAEGKKAAANSLISFGAEADKALENWMGTFIMRGQLLDPGLKKVGWGQMGKIVVVDVQSGRSDVDFEPIICPFDKQDKVPVRFGYGGDDPDPLPKNVKHGDVGFPITVLLPAKGTIKGVTWSLKDSGGKPIQCYTSTPEATMVKCDRVVHHAIAIIPKERLRANSTYTVSVKVSHNGKTFDKTWTFTTQ